MVSTTATPGTAASAPSTTAEMTRWKMTGLAKGRAASWTHTMVASLGTAASPRRTDSERVDPPST